MTATGSAPVILLGVNLPALKVIRSLGRRGIRVIGVVPNRGSWAQRSRYCEIRATDSAARQDDDYLAWLMDLATEVQGASGAKPLLVPLDDMQVLFMSRHRDVLSSGFGFLMADAEVMEALVSKSGLWALAREHGMAQPECFPVGSLQDVDAVAERLQFPLLIKPQYSMSWQTPAARAVVSGKVVVVDTRAELRQAFQRLATVDDRLILQSLIPGPDENLCYYVGYFDGRSEPLASFVGVKHRVTPAHFGSASYVTSSFNRDLIEMSTAFMRRVGYQGHVGIEYKYDARSGIYQLIEVNTRFGLWDGMAALCGIDFALLNYEYLTNPTAPAPIPAEYPDGVKWISMQRDWAAYREYHREGTMSLGDWLRSISRGKRDYAVFAADDIAPFIFSTAEMLGKRLRRRPTTSPGRGTLRRSGKSL